MGRFFAWAGRDRALMLVVGLVGGFYLWAHESVAALQAHTSADAKQTQARLDPFPTPSSPPIALVIGYDHRAGDGRVRPRARTR